MGFSIVMEYVKNNPRKLLVLLVCATFLGIVIFKENEPPKMNDVYKPHHDRVISKDDANLINANYSINPDKSDRSILKTNSQKDIVESPTIESASTESTTIESTEYISDSTSIEPTKSSEESTSESQSEESTTELSSQSAAEESTTELSESDVCKNAQFKPLLCKATTESSESNDESITEESSTESLAESTTGSIVEESTTQLSESDMCKNAEYKPLLCRAITETPLESPSEETTESKSELSAESTSESLSEESTTESISDSSLPKIESSTSESDMCKNAQFKPLLCQAIVESSVEYSSETKDESVNESKAEESKAEESTTESSAESTTETSPESATDSKVEESTTQLSESDMCKNAEFKPLLCRAMTESSAESIDESATESSSIESTESKTEISAESTSESPSEESATASPESDMCKNAEFKPLLCRAMTESSAESIDESATESSSESPSKETITESSSMESTESKTEISAESTSESPSEESTTASPESDMCKNAEFKPLLCRAMTESSVESIDESATESSSIESTESKTEISAESTSESLSEESTTASPESDMCKNAEFQPLLCRATTESSSELPSDESTTELITESSSEEITESTTELSTESIIPLSESDMCNNAQFKPLLCSATTESSAEIPSDESTTELITESSPESKTEISAESTSELPSEGSTTESSESDACKNEQFKPLLCRATIESSLESASEESTESINELSTESTKSSITEESTTELLTASKATIPTTIPTIKSEASTTQSSTKITSIISKSTEIVETTSGKLKGKQISVFGVPINAFVGIRYARPPIGKLRYSLPQPIKWDGIRDAIRYTKMCPQNILSKDIFPGIYISEEISEDCLSLNIWTPELKPQTLRTVMVYIPGGSFNYLTANLHDINGRVLSRYGDVVVVTINYRVSSFGFLNAGIKEAPGNMGIYDQSLALNWIKDNIKNFGGDPQNIVLFGQSAGSISVGIHMVFNRSKSIFSRAIMQSGAPLLPGIVFSRTREYAEKLAKLCNCSNDYDNLETNPKKVINCLKILPMNFLIKAEGQIINNSQIAFVPAIDTFYKDLPPPLTAIADPNTFSNIKEVLFGLVPDEGSWFLHSAFPDIFGRVKFPDLITIEETRDMFIKWAVESQGFPEKIAKTVSKGIKGPDTDTPINNVRNLYGHLGDASITCPTIYWADELVNKNKSVYAFLFNHKPKNTRFGEWQGVIHYEEVPFVFGYPLRKKKEYTNDDIELSKRMMNIWSHFAKTGHMPNQFNLQWPLYNNNEEYMVLEPNKSSLIQRFHHIGCTLYKATIELFERR